MELETVNKLYLELSQFATAKTKNDLELRLRKARNLERELQINLPGIALALGLLAELDALRRIVRLLPPLADAVDVPLKELT